jgi:hypothetical protein
VFENKVAVEIFAHSRNGIIEILRISYYAVRNVVIYARRVLIRVNSAV